MLGIGAISAYMGPYMTNVYKSVINTIDSDQFVAHGTCMGLPSFSATAI